MLLGASGCLLVAFTGLAEPLAVVLVAVVLPFDLSSSFVDAALASVAGIMVVRRRAPPIEQPPQWVLSR